MSAANDPEGTVRRLKLGFAHLIKLLQPEGQACWDMIDLYGSCGELFGYANGLLTNEEVDKGTSVVVYTPDPDWGC